MLPVICRMVTAVCTRPATASTPSTRPAPASPTQTTYFSVSPYKFGAANAKFRVAPDPQSCPEYVLPKQNQALSNFLRSALNQQLSTDRVAACFVLQIQRQNPQ